MNSLNLYSFCDKWFEKGGAIWLFSDPHFNDLETYKLNPGRPATEELIRRINSKCGKKDTLICLGDVGDLEVIKKLKAGYKILIMGNHDTGKIKFKSVFNEVYEGPLIIRKDIILSHEEAPFKYAFNIHGHDHSASKLLNTMFKRYDSDLNTNDYITAQLDSIKVFGLTEMNCCYEWLGFNLLNLNDLIKSGVLSSVPNIHRETIEKRCKNQKK